MELIDALKSFDALSQETRLKVVRLLIMSGDEGLLAGDMARNLQVLPNTLSTNLSILQNAGLVRRQRQGRAIRYHADFDGLRAVLRFLMQDCCGGNPDLCQPIIDELACA